MGLAKGRAFSAKRSGGDFRVGSVPKSRYRRYVHFIASNCTSLIQCLHAILEAIFATAQGKIHFQILLPPSAARSVGALQSTTGGDLRLRAPDPAFRAEQVLDCYGTLRALSTQLCRFVSGLQFPLIYQWGTQYETNADGHLQPQSDLDISLDAVISQSRRAEPTADRSQRKRETQRDEQRVAKRARQHSWRPDRGQGSAAQSSGSRR